MVAKLPITGYETAQSLAAGRKAQTRIKVIHSHIGNALGYIESFEHSSSGRLADQFRISDSSISGRQARHPQRRPEQQQGQDNSMKAQLCTHALSGSKSRAMEKRQISDAKRLLGPADTGGEEDDPRQPVAGHPRRPAMFCRLNLPLRLNF